MGHDPFHKAVVNGGHTGQRIRKRDLFAAHIRHGTGGSGEGEGKAQEEGKGREGEFSAHGKQS